MKKQVKWAALLIAVLVVGAALYYTLTAPLAVEVVEISPRRAEVYFTAQGVHSHGRTYQLAPLVSGRIEQVYFAEGDTIEAGQALMRIAADDYAHQVKQLEITLLGYEAQKAELQSQEAQRKQAIRDNLDAMTGEIKAIRGQRYNNKYNGEALEANIEAARMIVKNNEQLVIDAQARVDNAKADYEERQTPETWAELEVAGEKLKTAEKDYRSSMIDLDKIQQGDVVSDIYFEGLLEKAAAQEAALEASLEADYTGPMTAYYDAQIGVVGAQIAQLRSQSGDCTLIAPVSGVIDRLPAADTNLAVTGQPAALIGIGSAVEVYVPLREINSVSVGQPVTLIFENTGGDIEYAGTVSAIDDQAEVQITALGVEERRVKVTVDTDAPLGLGYAVDVKFVSYGKDDALLVPKAALFTDQAGNDCVFVVTGGALGLRAVEKGMETREGFVIDGGLEAGDVIIKDANIDGLVEGRAVAY